jgi:hypothetical protein
MMRWSSAVQRGSREGERLVDGNLHLPDGNLPKALSAPAMDSPQLQGGEDEQERERVERGRMSSRGRFERRGSVFIPSG